MIRTILIQIALFLLPTVMYLLWARLAQWLGWRKVIIPTYLLLTLGGVLVLGGLVLSTTTEPAAGSKYQPAQLVDGKIVDGSFERKPQ